MAVGSAPQNRQRPTFRAGTDVVTLTAFVRQGNLTVPGLTGSDFIVTDNGVRQTVTAIPGEAVPFDLTIVLDLSGSVEGMLDNLKRQVREVAALLRPDDRLRLVTFSDKIVDIFGFLPGDADLPLDDLARRPADPALRLDGDDDDARAAGGSRTGRRAPHRWVRHLEHVQPEPGPRVALRSEDVFHLFIVHPSPVGRRYPCRTSKVDKRGFWFPESDRTIVARRLRRPTQIMGDIARITGGEMSEVFERDHIPGDLKKAIDDFRASYILQYTVQGIDPKGRHKLTVKLNRPGDYSIRARREYEGG